MAGFQHPPSRTMTRDRGPFLLADRFRGILPFRLVRACAVRVHQVMFMCLPHECVRANAVAGVTDGLAFPCGQDPVADNRRHWNLLAEPLGLFSTEAMRAAHKSWDEQAIEAGEMRREEQWTGSIAGGSRSFVEEAKERPNIRAKGRRVMEQAEDCCLWEEQDAYGAIFQGEKGNHKPRKYALLERLC